jgi:hypothetical protein
MKGMTNEVETILNGSVQITKNPFLKFHVLADLTLIGGTGPIKLITFQTFFGGFIRCGNG